jgi:hypothetical protein
MGVFSLFLSVFLLVTLICYRISPKCIIEEKKEYVKFFLSFFIAYFALNGIATLALFHLFELRDTEGIMRLIFILALCPVFFIFHLLYPFKDVKRNQHLSFFLFFASLLSACVAMFGVMIALSNM